MEENSKLIWCLIIWVISAAMVLIKQLKKDSAGTGLGLAYLVNLGIIHWVASALYAIPGYSYYELSDVIAGLEQSIYGVVSFSIGYLMFTRTTARDTPPVASPAKIDTTSLTLREPTQADHICGSFLNVHSDNQVFSSEKKNQLSDAKLTNLFIVIGASCFLLNILGLGNIATLTSIISGGINLAVVGLMLKAWMAWHSGDRKSFLLWMAISCSYPLVTIITQGFIGYGIFNMILVLTFVARFYHPRWKLVGIGLVLGFCGLSMYVTYMRDRGEIRDTVWGGQSYGSRIAQLKSTFGQAELFNPYNNEHLERIDMRLNQNALVGASVHYMEFGRQEFAQGETLWQALLALVPRAIWPDKPVTAGSNNLVAKYTGLYFEEGTSIGVGQVMEFYINFGTWGVIGGFLVLGLIISFIDRFAGNNLAKNDWLSFTCWYLPGIAFMQVGGSLVEVSASAAGSFAIAILVKYLVTRIGQDESREQAFLRGGIGRPNPLRD